MFSIKNSLFVKKNKSEMFFCFIPVRRRFPLRISSTRAPTALTRGATPRPPPVRIRPFGCSITISYPGTTDRRVKRPLGALMPF